MRQSIPVLDLGDYLRGTSAQRSEFVLRDGRGAERHRLFRARESWRGFPLDWPSYASTLAFFDLDERLKRRYEDMALKGQRGFTSFAASTRKAPAPRPQRVLHVGRDFSPNHRLFKEYLSNVWPAEITDFRPVMTELYRQLDQCAQHLLAACSEFIGECEGVPALPRL